MKKVKFVGICLLSLVVISALYVAPSIITGSTKFLIVLSGSMDPVMRVGDVVVITHVEPEDVSVGDIIAYKDPSGRENVIITHRVEEVIEDEDDTLSFKTKGDANEDIDQYVVSKGDIVGKAVFLIPFIGYLFHYAREPLVFISLVIIPAGFIIADELRKIIRYSNPILACRAKKEEKEKMKKKRKTITMVNYKRLLTILFISTIVFGAFSLPSLAESGYVKSEYIKSGTFKIENQDILPCVFVFNSSYQIQHENVSTTQNYIVLPEKNNAEVMLNKDDSREYEPERTSIAISKCPYILPVFWIVIMTKVNPYLPSIVSLILPSILLTLALFPIWLQKSPKRRKYKTLKRRRLYNKLKNWR
jgi:signal peptidase